MPVTVTVSAAKEKFVPEGLNVRAFEMVSFHYIWNFISLNKKIIKGVEENSIIYSLRRITKGNKNFPFGS